MQSMNGFKATLIRDLTVALRSGGAWLHTSAESRTNAVAAAAAWLEFEKARRVCRESLSGGIRGSCRDRPTYEMHVWITEVPEIRAVPP